jgi:hypothetical protein
VVLDGTVGARAREESGGESAMSSRSSGRAFCNYKQNFWVGCQGLSESYCSSLTFFEPRLARLGWADTVGDDVLDRVFEGAISSDGRLRVLASRAGSWVYGDRPAVSTLLPR